MILMEDNTNLQSLDDGLAEIEQSLELMLALARVSASDLNVDRRTLQATLERLQRKIDRIADGIDTLR